ncbi:MAG: HEPN domain-containing protein [Candidatus Woesearchaeota archaeon]
MRFDKQAYEKKFKEMQREGLISESNSIFKIRLFFKKAESSYLIALYHKNPPEDPEKLYWWQWSIVIAYYSMLYSAKAAILNKGFEVKTHDAAQIALGYLLVPDELEKEDMEFLDQTHKIFEDEYVKYFEDARTESNTARYKARPSYTEKRVNEILAYAKEFIGKINVILEKPYT